ncbi:hypothetical protein COHA_006242 [Chlorella ohadii]|uniref:MYND-type domain-containing protein n=1 Tax=Chlorella ohadii TaxID=2649997 RepID=A0AAD5H123_9CHLO|nr:hypothetical protein COHA_006242 [Chlorella ohadii]
MDFTVSLHRIFLDDAGQRRQDLTAQDKDQALALLVQVALRTLAAPVLALNLDEQCEAALSHMVDELSGSGPSSVAVEPSTRTLARACLSVMCVVLGTTGCPDSLRTTLQNMEAVRSHPGHAVVKQALFQRAEQHTAALNPPVTAADLQQLDGLLELQAAHRLIQMGGERQQLNKLKDTALRAIQRLRALGAGSNAAFLHRRASDVLAGAGKLREALPESRAALRLATAEKAHVAVMASCLGLTTLLMSGAGGPQFSKQEVEDLLAQGRRARHLCKRWIPSQVSASYKQTLRQQEEYLAETLSLQPGRDLLDVDDEEFVPMTITSAPRCWGCGRHSSTLRKCSACHEAAYCSHECQRQHWRAEHRSSCMGRANAS